MTADHACRSGRRPRVRVPSLTRWRQNNCDRLDLVNPPQRSSRRDWTTDSMLCLAKIVTELYRRIKWLRPRCVPGLSSITVTAVPDQTSDRSATPSYRGPRITRFKLPQQLLCNSRVAVVQATDTRVRNYRAAAHARFSSTRRLFLQGQMSSVVVIVRHVSQKKSL
jgi:hypothetical protein